MRCLTLADAMSRAGWTCAVACNQDALKTVPALAESGYDVMLFDIGAKHEATALAKRWPQGCDLLVVDHYDRDTTFEAACRPWARRILVIDDLADRPHDCDLLLDQTPGRREQDYRPLVPSGCALLLGGDFALLRQQFLAARRDALARRNYPEDAKRILVSLGASDPDNVTATVLAAIAASGIEAAVDVVVGAASPHIAGLRRIADTMPNVSIHVGVADMAALMVRADIAIGAGGTTSWERCCLGLPTLMVVTADNQTGVAATLERLGAATSLGEAQSLTSERLVGALGDLFADGQALHTMAHRAADICDGRGALRICCVLLPDAAARDGKTVTLRPAVAADSDTMFRWQSDTRVRQFARTAKSPIRAEHDTWFANVMADPARLLCLIEHDGTPAGVLRFDRLEQDSAYEISIYVDPDKFGLGIGSAGLALGRQLFPTARLIAEVLPGNEASHKLFTRSGYRSVETGRYVSEPATVH
jgi:UDP-2,4-diacetamido-2,4,6-trideoxy-beta-L-altropyranose hydrolase